MAEAQVWYRKAAKQANALPEYNDAELAAISSRGPIELRDLAEAAKWWTAAAEHGDPLAQYEIGLCFASGSGVKKSDREALRWWQKAAQQDEMYALDAIGDFYAGGRGVKQDYAEAIRWWTKAAELGNIKKYVVRTLRNCMLYADTVKTVQEQITLFGVLVLEPLVIVITEAESGNGSLLKRRSCTDCKEVVDLLDSIYDMRRCDDIAKSPAGNGIGLGK